MISLIAFSIFMLVVLPIASLLNLLLMPTHYLEWLVIASQTTTLFFLNRVVGRWYWFGYYARHISMATLITVVIYSFVQISPHELIDECSLPLLFANLMALCIYIGYFFKVRQSQFPPTPSFQLTFPLRGKRYYVNEAGSNRVTNNHHTNEAQRFALDFYQLDGLGRRSIGFYPKDLTKYTIFGKALYSPIVGIIIEAKDGLRDISPTEFDNPELDKHDRAGNHVVIKTVDDKYIVMGHLKQGTVAVKKGDLVDTSTFLGEVGSSGRSEEPHLHIHCMDTLEEDYVRDGHGIPISFNGQYLMRNDLVSY